ncbi:DUF2127 domain-containing protein [Glaciihabitans sp. UYNi722]|uniref:DUF2127 domain-containing protein n=1 Tax=Glaciihabitans sp. UYNi722 TaxID=3156344 RepID=UPI00339B231D
MILSRRDHILDVVFLVGVFFKGLDGLVELIGGVLLLFLSPSGLTSVAHSLTGGELLEDPHDIIANLLIKGAHQLGGQGAFFISLFLLIHGVVKLAIVISLIVGATKIYPWAIGALGILAIVQSVGFVVKPSIGVALLTILDFVVIALTWREWRQHRGLKETLCETIAWIRSAKASRQS